MASKTMVQCALQGNAQEGAAGQRTGGREVDSRDCNCATPADEPGPAGQLDDACHLYVVVRVGSMTLFRLWTNA